jgi:hypothetical protein
MKQIDDVPMPEVHVPCASNDHWFDLITTGKCERCQVEWMAAAEDEQMKHREFPSDAEIDAMSEHYEKLTAML